MRDRVAEPLEEVANRIARGGGMPAGQKRSHRQDQNDSPEQAIHKCCHSALRRAVFKISGAFLGRTGATASEIGGTCFRMSGARKSASLRISDGAPPRSYHAESTPVAVDPVSLGRTIFALMLSVVSHTFSRDARLMNFFVCVVIGAVLGALDGAGIFFAREEPYKWQIFLAATLKGALVGLLAGFSLAPSSRWWTGIGTGALYGFAFALVVYLAKGGPQSGDAPYVIPSGIIFGALTGLFIVILAFKKI